MGHRSAVPDHVSDWSAKRPHDPEVTAVEEELAKALGTRVRIRHGRRRGSVVIDYYSLDDLERIRHVIAGQRAVVDTHP